MSEKIVLVKIGGIDVVRKQQSGCPMLKTTLGSCVGIILSDQGKGIHGMAHIMLPERVKKDPVLGKYADTAIPELLKRMEDLGSSRESVRAYLIGGACMFKSNNGSDIARIGERNVETSKSILSSLEVPVVYESTGGNHGMTVIFDGDAGKITVRRLSKELIGEKN